METVVEILMQIVLVGVLGIAFMAIVWILGRRKQTLQEFFEKYLHATELFAITGGILFILLWSLYRMVNWLRKRSPGAQERSSYFITNRQSKLSSGLLVRRYDLRCYAFSWSGEKSN